MVMSGPQPCAREAGTATQGTRLVSEYPRQKERTDEEWVGKAGLKNESTDAMQGSPENELELCGEQEERERTKSKTGGMEMRS